MPHDRPLSHAIGDVLVLLLTAGGAAGLAILFDHNPLSNAAFAGAAMICARIGEAIYLLKQRDHATR